MSSPLLRHSWGRHAPTQFDRRSAAPSVGCGEERNMHVRTVGIMAILILLLLVASSPSAAQPRGHMPVVGVLSPATSEALSDPKRGLSAFVQGLRELGYVEGQTLRLEYRFADYQWDQL